MNRLAIFFSAPHRAMFFGGSVQLLLVALWWAVELGARVAGRTLFAYVLPPGWLHGVAIAFGVFPFFMFGFAMTALPRWQAMAPLPQAVYRRSFLLLAGGWALLDLALWLPSLAALGAPLALAGLALGAQALVRVALHPKPGRAQLMVAVAGFVTGVAAGACLVAASWGAGAQWLRAGLTIGLWGFAAPVFAAVGHRVIPSFSGSALRDYRVATPLWTLYALYAGLLAHGLLALAGGQHWLWLADAPAAAIALGLTRHWQPRRSFAVPMLAVLHLGYAWLGLALALSAAQSLAALAGHAILGLAPVHALTIGFCGTLLLGMASRVTQGHSGREVSADPLVWYAMWALQAVLALRIGAELTGGAWGALLAWAAACGWLAVFGAWALRYAPWFWRARADGRPG